MKNGYYYNTRKTQHKLMQIINELRPELQIVNTVTTAELDQKVDIGSFNQYEFLESNLDLYRCGYVKDNKMTGRVTIFANGKMISVGTRDPNQSVKELKKTVKILKDHGLIKSKRIKPLVRNIVANTDFKQILDIEKLARSMPKSMYEPEIFPGLIHRIQGSCVALIFASGKVVIVGGKTYEEINSAWFYLNQYFIKINN
jgi:transcription initiation factor TFIID TATA-box-binding protein